MRITASPLLVPGLVFAGSAMLAAPQTQRPGEMTQARVWVQNAPNEPVPIALQQNHLENPLRVLVLNGDPSVNVSAPTGPLRVRIVPPAWEYRTVTIRANEDPAKALANPGNEGWETTGLTWPGADGTLVLLKKPR